MSTVTTFDRLVLSQAVYEDIRGVDFVVGNDKFDTIAENVTKFLNQYMRNSYCYSRK